MGRYTIWFGDIQITDIGRVGTKSFDLNTIYNSKNPIPKGFVITTEGYELFMKQIQRRVDEQLDDLHIDNKAGIEQAAQRIQKLILTSNLPYEIIQPTLEYYGKMDKEINLGKKLQGYDFLKQGEKAEVAVRSSPVSEKRDSLGRHKFITFLSVKGVEQLKRAILGAYASVFSTENIIERLRNNVYYIHIKNPVLVQEMVPSDKSGIMITTSIDNPKNNNYNIMDIRAIWGIGGKIDEYSGDWYLFNKKDNQIVKIEVERQDWAYYGGAKGKVSKHELSGNKVHSQKLSVSDLSKLGDLAIRLERLYNRVFEVHFAFDGDSLWVISAKPGEFIKVTNKEEIRNIITEIEEEKIESPEDTPIANIGERRVEGVRVAQNTEIERGHGREKEIESNYEQEGDWVEIRGEQKVEDNEGFVELQYEEHAEEQPEGKAEFNSGNSQETNPEIKRANIYAEPQSYAELAEIEAQKEVEDNYEEQETKLEDANAEYSEENLTLQTPDLIEEGVEENLEGDTEVEEEVEVVGETPEEYIPEINEEHNIEEGFTEIEPEKEETPNEVYTETPYEDTEEEYSEETPHVTNEVAADTYEEETANEIYSETFESKVEEQLKRYAHLYPHSKNALRDFAEEINNMLKENK